jgi:hypothetical protein
MKKTCCGFLAFFSMLATARSEPNHYERILTGMSKLVPLVGKWDTIWKFHDRDGVTEFVGTTRVTAVQSSSPQP